MAWGKAGSDTLTGTGDVMTVSDMSANKSNQILIHSVGTGQTYYGITFNNNTNSVYAERRSPDGGSDLISTNQTKIGLTPTIDNNDSFTIVYLSSISGEEKLLTSFSTFNGQNGAGNVPERREVVGKFVPSPDADITRVDITNGGTGDFLTDSNVSVIGSDITPAAAIPAIPSLLPSLQSPSVGGWVEVGRTTLGSTGNSIDISGLTDKRYYMFLTHAPTDSSGYVLDRYRLNADTGSNYSYRASLNGGADGTGTSQSEGIVFSDGASVYQAGEIFTVGYISNLSGKEKLLIGHTLHNEATGVGTFPDRAEGVGKHAQTSNPVTSVNCVNTNNTGFASGSECVVLGWDPADTHTSNFWEELASVELTSSGDQISSGTITAKKYLWIQVYIIPTGTVNSGIRFNSDQATNYALRYSSNGGADATATSTSIGIESGSITIPNFVNMFTINNASNEKLGWLHGVLQNTAGAGTAPSRLEQAHKWANTSDQITQIDVDNFGAGSFDTGSILKVWGAD